MRWKRLTDVEKRERNRTMQAQWRREFALTPVHCDVTKTVFWLEWVWYRGCGEWKFNVNTPPWSDGYKWSHTERRGGRLAPEIKQQPEGSTP